MHDQSKTDMVAPNSSGRFALTKPGIGNSGPVTVHYSFINDYGAIVTGEAAAGSAP